jgi:Mg2+ and Co2+ transporter CorA
VLWAILDQVVDGYAPVVAGLDVDIDQIEATVFSGTVAPTERIYKLRREATDFYRAVHPLLGVVTTIQRVSLPLTFVTGFFGQNFRWLVGDISTPLAFFVYGLGGLVVPLGLLFLWLRRRRKHPTPAPAMRVAAMDGDR